MMLRPVAVFLLRLRWPLRWWSCCCWRPRRRPPHALPRQSYPGSCCHAACRPAACLLAAVSFGASQGRRLRLLARPLSLPRLRTPRTVQPTPMPTMPPTMLLWPGDPAQAAGCVPTLVRRAAAAAALSPSPAAADAAAAPLSQAHWPGRAQAIECRHRFCCHWSHHHWPAQRYHHWSSLSNVVLHSAARLALAAILLCRPNKPSAVAAPVLVSLLRRMPVPGQRPHWGRAAQEVMEVAAWPWRQGSTWLL